MRARVRQNNMKYLKVGKSLSIATSMRHPSFPHSFHPSLLLFVSLNFPALSSPPPFSSYDPIYLSSFVSACLQSHRSSDCRSISSLLSSLPHSLPTCALPKFRLLKPPTTGRAKSACCCRMAVTKAGVPRRAVRQLMYMGRG